MSSLASATGNVAEMDPEVALAKGATDVAKAHAGTILMMPMISVSILLIILGIIVYSAASNKVPGVMILLLGGGIGFGAFHVMSKSESRRQ